MDKLESTRIFREIFLKYLETLEQFDGRKKVGSSFLPLPPPPSLPSLELFVGNKRVVCSIILFSPFNTCTITFAATLLDTHV